MLRWSEDQLAEFKGRRAKQTKREAQDEGRQHGEPVKRAKYRNVKVVIDGRRFDSKAEGARYVELKKHFEAGIVTSLQCQVRYSIDVSGVHICDYVADFVYVDVDGNQVVEDVKGVRTRDYALKAKLMKAVHGIAVREVKKLKRGVVK
ncbi:MAG: DUF1064 domain-containing protein [Betaproteobacteria bacterium]